MSAIPKRVRGAAARPRESETLGALRRLRALSQVVRELSTLQGEQELLAATVRALLLYFEQARRVQVFLADETGRARVLSCERGQAPRPALSAGVDGLPASCRPLFSVPNLLDADRPTGRGSMMSAPLYGGSSWIGLAVVEADAAAPDFGAVDLDALAGIVAQLSLAVQHRRAEEKRATVTLLEHDLAAARRIQRSFLPALPPELNGFRVAAEYRPAFEVGGDFYDLVRSGEDGLRVMIGDGSGKGVSGALLMARIMSEMGRLSGSGTAAPRALLEQLNDRIAAGGCDDTFATAACLSLDAGEGRLTVANAGHVLPLIRRAGGEVLAFGAPSGPPLGMLPSQTYEQEECALDPGDIVLLATDGVIEALRTDEDPLGMETLGELLSRWPPDVVDIKHRIIEAIAERRGERLDDVTLILLELLPRS